MTSRPEHTTVRRGTFLYDDAVVCDLRIFRSPVRYGTGDAADPPEFAEDQAGDFYYIQYGSPSARGVYVAGSSAFSSLDDAQAHAERSLSRVRWEDSGGPLA
jgi:hypothetical protein